MVVGEGRAFLIFSGIIAILIILVIIIIGIYNYMDNQNRYDLVKACYKSIEVDCNKLLEQPKRKTSQDTLIEKDTKK